MEVGSDQTLCEARVGGDAEAFAALVARYHGLVCAVAFGATGNRMLSEDVAQDAFVIAWRSRHELRDPSRFRNWICAIARHLALNTRRERRHDGFDDEAVGEEFDPDIRLDQEQRDALVWAALAKVPERYRRPLVLFYREEKSAAEVAAQLGISTANAMQRLTRGRRYLKEGVESMIERSLAAGKPQRQRATAVIAALGSDAELPSSAGAALEAARASIRPASLGATIMKVAIGAAAAAALLVTLNEGCASWDGPANDADEPGPNAARKSDPSGAAASRSTQRVSGPSDTPLARAAARAAAAGDGGLGLPRYRLSIIRHRMVAVHLDGGPSEVTAAYPADPDKPMRKVTGRVVDARGIPVPGAVVLAGATLTMSPLEHSIVGSDGDETDARGQFELEQIAAKPCFVIALDGNAGWSDFVQLEAGDRTAELELELRAPIRVSGQARRGNEPQEGIIAVIAHEKRVTLSVPTDSTGRFDTVFPRGTYELGFQPEQSGRLIRKKISARAGEHITWDPVVHIGTRLAVDAPVPAAHADKAFMVWVYVWPGKKTPATIAELKARAKQTRRDPEARRIGLGGEDLGELFEFTDLSPGDHTICASAEAPKETLAMTCTTVTLSGADDVLEVAMRW